MNHCYSLQRSTHDTILRDSILAVLVLGILASPVFGQQIKINSGAYFKNNDTAYILINNADLVNNGTYAKGTETVTFSGNTANTITGNSTDIYNLSITNTGGITTQVNLFTVNTLTIASGSKFTIDPSKSVTVTGTLTNSEGNTGLVMLSDATGTASLIHNTDSVPATVNRYISGSAEAWHFMSSPVSDQSISGEWIPSGTYGNGTGYDLYVWNEASSCWIYKLNTTTPINWNTVHPGSDFMAGCGYLYSFQAANPTKKFAGNLNNSSLSYGLSFSGPDVSLKGFNLVGNPYPSSVDWQAASGWTRSDLITSGSGKDMWMWNPAANNYGVINSASGTGTNGVTRFIAPMQGFFVRAASAGNLGLTDTVRVHDGAGSWLKKSGDTDINRMSIIVNSDAGDGFDEVLLLSGLRQNEPGAIKLFSHVLSSPSLYFPLQGENLSVRYLTCAAENPVVPVMFKPGTDGKYTIQCSFDQDKFDTVILEDRQMNIFHDLKATNEYKFESSKTDDQSRFVLHFASVENPGNIELQAPIYTAGNLLIIDLSMINGETEVMVCDIIGRPLLRKMIQGEALHELSINSETQMLIIRLKNHEGMVCRKLMWIDN
jgi:hypothetical protein